FSHLGGGEFGDLFTVDPHYLLMARNDSRFDDGRKFLVLDRIRNVDLPFGQKVAQLLPAPIFAGPPDNRNRVEKPTQVTSDVGSAAGKKTFPGNVHDRHRSFGRNAADLAPDKFVQYQVADNQNVLGRRALEDLPKSF